MSRKLIAILLSLVAAAAAGAIVLMVQEPVPGPAARPAVDAEDYFDRSAGTEERIRALENAVATERNARQLLEEELQMLYVEIETLTVQLEAGPQELTDEQQFARLEAEANRTRMEERRRQREMNANERRLSYLIESGFSPDRAEWIVKRESELWMETMQAQYEASAAGEPMERGDMRYDAQSRLREEIGDDEYEQYLQALGRSTEIAITSVFESSPAQRAGLQPGDQILNYNGTRVFDIGELNRYTMASEPGSTVVVDIVRDGVPMQVVLPSGPIGVMISGRDGRRR